MKCKLSLLENCWLTVKRDVQSLSVSRGLLSTVAFSEGMLTINFMFQIHGPVVVASAESIISCLNSRNCSAISISLSELHHALIELDVAKVDWEHVSAIYGVGALMPNWPHLCRLTGEEQKWIYSPTETIGLTFLSSIKASLNSSKESIDYILSASFADCAKSNSLLDEHQQQSQTINLAPNCASRKELDDQIKTKRRLLVEAF
ncbi:hypothetical protein T12_13533 [Trichinella patagoniensis]|uniref:Uncharacterized protein n=1 Tax=Trichinella patagoniensis TaxID=990121 RepID=A0A0V1ADT2_9BILA|nr:hypothetical protein T12_13533 [Trichinella patagoniensis]